MLKKYSESYLSLHIYQNVGARSATTPAFLSTNDAIFKTLALNVMSNSHLFKECIQLVKDLHIFGHLQSNRISEK